VSTDNGSTFNNLAGATSTTLSFTATVPQNGYQYRAVFTNVVNSAASNAATLTVQPITFSPGILPNSYVGQMYSQKITVAHGTPPYTFAITGGSLPGGLSLVPSTALIALPLFPGFMLSGIPTTTGTSLPKLLPRIKIT